MTRFHAIAVATLVAGFLVSGAASQTQQPATTSAPAGGTPTIKLSQSSWDFGSVWHGETQSFKLVISNTGTGELKLARVQASCGCTAAQPAKMALAAGESTDVAITFNTHGKQGKVTSSVSIFSNDPATAQATFSISGEVKRAVTMTPMGGLVLRTIDTKPGQSSSVKLETTEPDPMKLEIQSKNCPGFDITIKEITPGKAYEVVGTTNAELPRGTSSGVVVVSTGLTREPTVSVPVQARVLERLNLVPPALLFMKEDDKPAPRTVNIEYYGSDPNFKITEATCRSKKVTLNLGPPTPPPDWQVKLPPAPTQIYALSLMVPPGKEFEEENIPIEILTNDKDYPRLEVMLTTSAQTFQNVTYKPTAAIAQPGAPAPPTPTVLSLPTPASAPAKKP